MGVEIERKFLVRSMEWKENAQGTVFKQGYLSLEPERTVRVRIVGEKGYLTIKGLVHGISRHEFEYEIPLDDARVMLEEHCFKPVLEKIRYRIMHEGFVWEVDEFLGENMGLIIAEVELEYESQPFVTPDWLGCEVSGDPRYYNSSLVKNPWPTWKDTK